MPELPDVEGFRRIMARHGAGKTIKRVKVRDARIMRNVSASTFSRALAGRRIRRPRRIGKWLLVPTDGPTVIFHFGMTGGLHWQAKEDARHQHDRVIFEVPDGEIRFRDQRLLQGIWLARDPESVDRIIGALGPDALSIDRLRFDQQLHRHRGSLKPVLMDQRVIAGLGNLLVDEILWQARLHPGRRTDRLTQAEQARLYRVMRRVLRASVPTGRVPAKRGWLTSVRGRGSEARCPRCRTRLRRVTIGGRSTYFCPRCQPLRRG